MTLDKEALRQRRNSDVAQMYFPRNSVEKENGFDSRRGSGNGRHDLKSNNPHRRQRIKYTGSSSAGHCPLPASRSNLDMSNGHRRRQTMKVGRSQSMRDPGKRTSDDEWIDHHRSSPSLGRDVDCDYSRLRNFSTTRKGAVINRGDSFRSKSRSSQSVTSSRSSRSSECPVPTGDNSTGDEPPSPVCYRVLMLGASEVGKTAITTQFKTSEYICACDASQDTAEEKTVTVIVDEEEAEMTFIDPQHDGDAYKFPIVYNPDAYVVVFSVTSRMTLRRAKEIIGYLQKNEESLSRRAIILVGNKIDLARSRIISTEEGKHVAKSYSCKYIETSVGINHNVDNLLVGILSQIRLKLKHAEKLYRKENNGAAETDDKRQSNKCKGRASSLLKRILRKAYTTRTKSCDNLQVL